MNFGGIVGNFDNIANPMETHLRRSAKTKT